MRALKKDNSGQYTRQIGWLKGRSGQKKFRLGRDRHLAEIAALKLEQLWTVVERQHKERYESRPINQLRDTLTKPMWTKEALEIAEAIRKYQPSIRVGVPQHPECVVEGLDSDVDENGMAYVNHIAYLHQVYGHIIQFVPADKPLAERGRNEYEFVTQHRSRQTQLAARMTGVPIPPDGTGTTLYQAIEVYAAHVENRNSKESSKVEAATARRLKDSIQDCDLSEFGYSALERLAGYWTSRPAAKLSNGKPTNKPIGITTVDNHLSTARRFVRWLDRTDQFKWVLPRYGVDALKCDKRRLRTAEGISQQREGVGVFDINQLTIIYRHANDFQRLIILLGLNACMAQAELMTLRWDEIKGDRIKRIRHKSNVYGEFALWPET